MKKVWKYFINFWKGIWNIIKSMGNWRGILALFIVWLIISGSGVFILGFIFQDVWLMGIGTTIYGFWLLPEIPLIAINISLAMVVQRFIFLDKNVTWESIKKRYKEAFEQEKKDLKNDSNFIVDEEIIKDESKKQLKEEDI